MKRNASIALALAALVLLAGCAQSNPPPADAPSTSSSATTSLTSTSSAPPLAPPPVIDLLLGFDLTGCRGLAIQHARPLDQVQALLPAGFNASAVPGSADPRGLVTIELYACGNFTIPGATVPDTYFGAVTALIERPTARVPGAPEAAVQEYLFRVLAGEDVLAVLWPAAGYDSYNGTAAVAVTGSGLDVDLGARSASGQVGPGYALAAAGTVIPGLPTGLTGSFARYTALQDASVLVWTGSFDFPSAATGQGTARLAADDPVAALGVGVPGQPTLAGTARLHDEGAIRAQDLRRVFTPATA